MQIRQGDVFLERIDKLPDGEQKIVSPEGSRLILVRGEATGHHHSVAAHNAIVMLIGTEMFLRCLKKTTLRHQEHGPIPVLPGNYRVTRQREYTPEEIRNVED